MAIYVSAFEINSHLLLASQIWKMGTQFLPSPASGDRCPLGCCSFSLSYLAPALCFYVNLCLGSLIFDSKFIVCLASQLSASFFPPPAVDLFSHVSDLADRPWSFEQICFFFHLQLFYSRIFSR